MTELHQSKFTSKIKSMDHQRSSNRRGVIIGAGIAGIATALFADEFDIRLDIYERDEQKETSDHLIWLAPNGLRVLEQLSLVDKILKYSVEQDIMGFTDRELTPLLSLRAPSLRQNCSYPIVAIKRCDLMKVLYEALSERGLAIHWGQPLSEAHLRSDSTLDVVFKSGKTLNVDFVVAADGIGSKLRNLVAPDSKVHYQGIRTWLGRSENVPIASRHVGKTLEVWGQATRFVLTSLDGQTVYWSALERSDLYEPNQAPIPKGTLERLQRLFSDYHYDVRTTLKHGVAQSLVRCNFGVVQGVEKTFKNNIILVGDAAHGMPPNMGQGASLGLEDGLWTAYGLSKAEGSVEDVFTELCQSRALRVEPILKMANSMNLMFQPKSQTGSFIRNNLAYLMPDRLAQKQIESLYQPAFPPSHRAQSQKLKQNSRSEFI
jgi:2-polyprenyl-6-methoxyphenol hydroxylase-like FAD-dependent oxidoreductase